MRRFRDNMYLFSMGRGHFGRILAYRSDRSRCYEKTLFDLYVLPREEIETALRILTDPVHDAVVVTGKGNDSRLLVICKLFYFESLLFLAVEPRFPAAVTVRLMTGGVFPRVLPSRGCEALAGELPLDYLHALLEGHDPVFQTDRDAYRYLSERFACLGRLEASDSCRGFSCRQFVSEAALAASALAGVQIKLADIEDERLLDARFRAQFDRNAIFSPMACSALLLGLSLLVREHCKARKLSVELLTREDGMLLEVRFEADYRRKHLSACLALLSEAVLTAKNIRCRFEVHKGTVFVEFFPFFTDVSLMSLKTNDPWRDWHIEANRFVKE